MTSTADDTRAPITVHGLARLVEGLLDAARSVSVALAADPALLAEVPDELLEAFTLALHSAADATTAAATVVTGRLERQVGSVRGKLIAGRYASTSRFLQSESGMSAPQARAAVARGRDLDTHSTRVAGAWLAGSVPGGAVRDLTVGVTDLLRRSSRTDTPIARGEALDHLLPLAERGDTDRLHRAVDELRLRIDPDGTTQAAPFAFENQTLSIAECGSMFRISGWVTPEAAAATTTVLDILGRKIVDEQLGDVAHDADCESLAVHDEDCSCGALARARRLAGLRQDQLRALALGEFMTDRLADAELGSHHRVAPHITVVADVTDAAGPMIGRLRLSGTDDETLLAEDSVNRLLCDADITRVLTTTTVGPVERSGAADNGSRTVAPAVRVPSVSAAAVDAPASVDAYLAAVTTTLSAMARSVLYVGYAERTVSARLRRALEVRDGHCVFPGCRARAARCHAHHVLPWQHGGATDLPNLALLCVTHHVAVHEGGWTMALKPGWTGHEQGCWDFTPPPLRARRVRP